MFFNKVINRTNKPIRAAGRARTTFFLGLCRVLALLPAMALCARASELDLSRSAEKDLIESFIRQCSASESDMPEKEFSVDGRVRRYGVSTRTFTWYDASRRRAVPAKIFMPIASDPQGPFPVIVFSHGLGGSYDRCSYLGRSWASNGFVAVLLCHPGSDESVWRGKVRFMNELRESYKRNWTGRTRANDIRFVLDRLERLVQEDEYWADRIDPDRIGVGGYDLGALASLLVVGQTPPDGGESLYDPRVKAALPMSSPVHCGRGGFRNTYGSIDVPVFFISGTEDDGIIGSTKASQRRIPFDFMQENDRYLVVLHGADHLVYGGHVLSMRARNDKTFQATIVRVSTCFWQAHLRGDRYWRDVLDGHGLGSLAGGMARIERRTGVAEREVATHQPPIEEKPASETTVERQENETIPEEAEKPLFPLTGYYRRIVSKYETETVFNRETALP